MVAPSFEIAGRVTAGLGSALFIRSDTCSLLVPDGHPMLSSELVNDPNGPCYHHNKDRNAFHFRSQCTLRPVFTEAYTAVGLTKLCHRGSRRLLVDRRKVIIVSEVVVDGREILAGVSFPHCEAIQFLRSIG